MIHRKCLNPVKTNQNSCLKYSTIMWKKCNDLLTSKLGWVIPEKSSKFGIENSGLEHVHCVFLLNIEYR